MDEMLLYDGFTVITKLIESFREFKQGAVQAFGLLASLPDRKSSEMTSLFPKELVDAILSIKSTHLKDPKVQIKSSAGLLYLLKNGMIGSFVNPESFQRQIIETIKKHFENTAVLESQIALLNIISIDEKQCSSLRDQGLVLLVSRALFTQDNIQHLRQRSAPLLRRLCLSKEIESLVNKTQRFSQQLRSATCPETVSR